MAVIHARRRGLDVDIVATGRRRPAGLGPWLAAVAPSRARGSVIVALVSDATIRALNRTYRGKDAPTDVLSFPAFARTDTPRASAGKPDAFAEASPHRGAGEPQVLGDIVIAIGVCTRQARAEGHAFGTECRILALHGLLHLLGYDHEVDDGRMARTEARLRRRGGLPTGLIGRSAGRRPARPRRR